MKKLPKVINGFKILKDFGYANGSRRCLAICKVCKREYEVDPNKLVYRLHCGCRKRGAIANRHNKQYPRIGNTFKHMLARCYNVNNKDYYNYGAKGIKVCKEWKKDRNKFIEWALNNGYRDDLTIDRIDNKKGYYPNNCRWSDAKSQARNTRRNILTMELAREMRLDRGKMTYKQISLKYKCSYATVCAVMCNYVWRE